MKLLTADQSKLVEDLASSLRLVESIVSKMLQPDGSWADCPAAYKREMLNTVRLALSKVPQDEEGNSYQCPIHGETDSTDCPR